MHFLLLVAALSTAPDPVALRAADGDRAAIAELRAAGQDGVDRMLALQRDDATYRESLDRVCGQRDCRYSHLFWYTDFDAALADAQRTHRPILSLRLLGRLDEDLSCANSRFFRTVLYSNAAIARLLRANYVLHWSSERPAPRVTVDYGDGRMLHRTITGNSIHYVLDANGHPYDALPGLYAPVMFLSELQTALAVGHFRDLTVKPVPNTRSFAELAMTKGTVELALMKLVFQVNAAHEDHEPVPLAELDDSSIALIREKHAEAGGDFDAMLATFRRSISEDTVRNETELRPRIRKWMGAHRRATLAELNAFVYRDVFLTAPDDPWLGLVPRDTFSAIDGEGMETRGGTMRNP